MPWCGRILGGCSYHFYEAKNVRLSTSCCHYESWKTKARTFLCLLTMKSNTRRWIFGLWLFVYDVSVESFLCLSFFSFLFISIKHWVQLLCVDLCCFIESGCIINLACSWHMHAMEADPTNTMSKSVFIIVDSLTRIMKYCYICRLLLFLGRCSKKQKYCGSSRS